MNQWHLITKRPAAFQSLGLSSQRDLTNIDPCTSVFVDKQLLQQQDPLINCLPPTTCFFIEPAELDVTYHLVSEIVVPTSMTDGLFANGAEAARRVRVFHKSHPRYHSKEGNDDHHDSGVLPNE